jgi:hypothetical protein
MNAIATATGLVDPRRAFNKELHLHPWRQGEIPQHPPTMLSPDELRMLRWLAAENYQGAGTIVDAGCFLGGSTCALAAGLSANLHASPRLRRIHSYDLFVIDWYMKRHYLQDSPLQIGDSFLDLFETNIRHHRDLVSVHPGNVLDVRWSGEPIEILFLDIIKDRAINRVVLEQFFPRLIPGVSVVVQQDYVHEWLPWLHVTMEALADYFEPLDYFDFGSAMFRLTREIPAESLEQCITGHRAEEQLALMDGAIARCPAEYRVRLECARVLLLHQVGLRGDALDMLRHIEVGNPQNDRAQLLVSQIKRVLNTV